MLKKAKLTRLKVLKAQSCVKKLQGSISRAQNQTPLTQVRLRSLEDFLRTSFKISGILKKGIRKLAKTAKPEKKSAKERYCFFNFGKTEVFCFDEGGADIKHTGIDTGRPRPDHLTQNCVTKFKEHIFYPDQPSKRF